ncbi:hypothetical protein LF1_34580 [Rubripirellula obstinata]|uniref:Translational regulator CsrA n=1 Tax=Rubripirellula obstinata TaxID=406547 RepID=A0A5B1CK15_9BACT|nr:carbon storage regulator [Rubripirellula obstinata]KAA1260916.1 hypothetical protein LF1_34580 [Rubripirellula obstinata]
MLVLSRKDGETIEIPELGIVIQVTSIKKSKVTIGIEAPKELAILRGEMVGRTSEPKNQIQANPSPGSFAVPASPMAAVKEPASDYSSSAANEPTFFQVA